MTEPRAYGIYAKNETVHHKSRCDEIPLSTQYRRIFGISRPVVIHFVGVWVGVYHALSMRKPTHLFVGYRVKSRRVPRPTATLC
jgi:hypothetical protein